MMRCSTSSRRLLIFVSPDIILITLECGESLKGSALLVIIDTSLENLVANAGQNFPYEAYYDTPEVGGIPVFFGKVDCYEKEQTMISVEQCKSCIKALYNRLKAQCPHAETAKIMAHDCIIQYDNKKFEVGEWE